METGKTLRGSAKLAFDATEGLTNAVEGMYRNISATPWPLGDAPQGPAPGIAGVVHESIRAVTRVARGGTDWVLGRVSPTLDRTLPPGPYREAVIAALNGVCGDHLEQSGNSLAIPMRFRVLLPPSPKSKALPIPEAPQAYEKAPFADLFEMEKRPVEVWPQRAALDKDDFIPGRRLLILVHGLSMNDRAWTSQQHNHAEALAQSEGYTPVYALYNSGRNVSTLSLIHI